MNLREALNYRTHCVFCQNKLSYYLTSNIGYMDTTFYEDYFGLHIKDSIRDIIIHWDGHHKDDFFSPICLVRGCMRCSKCYPKDLATFEMSLNSTKQIECSYSIKLSPGANHAVNCKIISETFRYADDKRFFQLWNGFELGADFYHSSFSKPISDILSIKLNVGVNTEQIKTTEQFINRCNTIINFS
jgi:hypothetical protein